MIRLDKHTFKNGVVKTQVRVVEGYRDKDKKMKQRTIKNFGYLEAQIDQDAFLKEVKVFDEEFKKRKKTPAHSIKVPFDMDNTSLPFNYGYIYLESIYNALKLDEFFSNYNTKFEYNINDIFKFFTIQRILNPSSKRSTHQLIESLYNFNIDFELHDVYRSLDFLDKVKVDLQKHINDQIKKLIGRDSSYAFYDVTNYYTEIDIPKSEDDLRQRGVSKEHRVDPIIQLGLFIDSNGIPISMSLFKGNTSDSKTLQPVMREIKDNYNLNRLIVVADKGLNSSSNINYIVNNGDGYVVSQILKGKKGKRYQDKLFEEDNYIYNIDGSFKYQTFIEDYEIINNEGNKEIKQRKVLIYWKKEDAIKEEKKREDKLERAKKSLTNNAYAITHSYEQYIKEIHSVSDTGEVASKTSRTLDNNKIDNDSMYDGYFCIITSELDYDYKKILEVYSGLWRIEESFKITKSELETRPIYLNTEAHINGHFLMCYVALVIIRLLQYKMNYSLSVERIVKALNTSKCLKLENGLIKVLRNESTKEYKDKKLSFSDDDQIINDFKKIIKSFNNDIPWSTYEVKEFNKYLDNIKY